MMISFGKDKTHWTNYGRSQLTDRLAPEIKKFGRILKLINKLEFLFIFVPISAVLRLFGFSDEFQNEMVFPLTALFFGTGNQTPNVSAAIMARVFLDDDLRLFDYDPQLLLSQTPEMFAFPNLGKMYQKIVSSCKVNFHGRRGVKAIRRSKGRVHATDKSGVKEEFDAVVFACDAESALKMLEDATYMERTALGNVRYYNDITVTHEDDDYMNKYYEVRFLGAQVFTHPSFLFYVNLVCLLLL